MSSYLKIISSSEPIIPNLTNLALIKWVLSNVHENKIGTCCGNKKVYLNPSELPEEMYTEFKEAVYSLTKNKANVFMTTHCFWNEPIVSIPTEIVQSLYNEHTLSIEHERLGPFSKEQWIEYCKSQTFYVYLSVCKLN
jgi:hypothetical protein